jgi:uncharacterized lipoprotein NlpE involved in copper resistance
MKTRTTLRLALIGLSLLAVILVTPLAARSLGGDTPPAAVTEAFAKKYPKAQKVKWELQEGRYLAEFKLNNNEQHVAYNADGAMAYTTKELEEKQVPMGVKKNFAKEHPEGKMQDYNLLTLPTGQRIYELKIKEAGQKTKVYYEATGKAYAMAAPAGMPVVESTSAAEPAAKPAKGESKGAENARLEREAREAERAAKRAEKDQKVKEKVDKRYFQEGQTAADTTGDGGDGMPEPLKK